MSKLNNLYIIVFLLIVINIILASWLPIKGDIVFHPDQARDMLLLEDIRTTNFITLIGPRSLGIPGLFHGPLWAYINLPAFIVGNGDPAVVGIYWSLLYICTIYIIYFVASKLFDKAIGLLSALLFSVVFIHEVPQMINPYGAVLLFPLFFLFTWLYFKSNHIKYIAISSFILGLMIQFQVAFAGPILLIYLCLIIFQIIKNTCYKHLLGLLGIIPPLSTYILFELKNGFLQTKAIVEYLTQSQSNGFISIQLVSTHFSQLFFENIGMITRGNSILIALFIGVTFFLAFRIVKGKVERKYIYYLFGTFYFGYWLLTFLYNGQLWVWYHYQLVPLLIIFLCSAYTVINKRIFIVIFSIFYLTVFYHQLSWFNNMRTNFIGKGTNSWLFFKETVKTIYETEQSDFGYYVHEDDSLGYRGRYAFNYLDKFYPAISSHSNTKKTHTYILNATLQDNTWWKVNQVRIQNEPDVIIKFENGYKLEKFILSDEELLIPSDRNLIDNLIFR